MLLADLAEDELGALVRECQDRRDDLTEMLEQVPAERDPEHEDRENQLQHQTPGDDPPGNSIPMAGEEVADPDDRRNAEQTGETAHDGSLHRRVDLRPSGDAG